MVLHIHEVSSDSTDNVGFGLFRRLGRVEFEFVMRWNLFVVSFYINLLLLLLNVTVARYVGLSV